MRSLKMTRLPAVALALSAAAGCAGGEPYYDDPDAVTIDGVEPALQDGIIGGEEVAISGDFSDCEDPSVVFGFRNAEVLTQDASTITVLTPTGPVSAGEVDVQVACASGQARLEGGFTYDDHGVVDLFENEYGSFSLLILGGPFLNFPQIIGSGQIWQQAVPRSASFMGFGLDAPDALTTGVNARAQVPPEEFSLPGLRDRLYAGDKVSFTTDRDLPNSVLAEDCQYSDVFGVQRTNPFACYLAIETLAAPNEQGATLPETRYYRVDHRAANWTASELPLLFALEDLSSPIAAQNEVWDEDGDGIMFDGGIDLPTGTYNAYVCKTVDAEGDDEGAYPWLPDGFCSEREFLFGYSVTEGDTTVDMGADLAMDFHWDLDGDNYFSRAYTTRNEAGAALLTTETPLNVTLDGGSSFGVEFPPITEEDGVTITVPAWSDNDGWQGPLDSVPFDQDSFSLYIDPSEDLTVNWDVDAGAPSTDFVTLVLTVDDFGLDLQSGNLFRISAWAPYSDGTITIPATELVDLPLVEPGSDLGGIFNFSRHRVQRFPFDPSQCAGADELDDNDGDADRNGEQGEEACSDGIDNDNDGLVDGVDGGCDSDECRHMVVDVNHVIYWQVISGNQCEDEVDNDGDGLVDGSDPSCVGDSRTEQNGDLECDDGEDNDDDGFIDLEDPECDALTDGSESAPDCTDGYDNDLDGWVDAADPGCEDDDTEEGGPDDLECNDGIDNDGDLLVDANDPACTDAYAPSEISLCEDGEDNDDDGWIDEADPDCSFGASENSPTTGFACNDGEDNDGDGLIDAEDDGCEDGFDSDETVPTCGDGLDNDGDGWIDELDPDCVLGESEIEPVTGFACNDGVDNDGDGLVDAEDPGCADGTDGDEEAPGCEDTIDNDGDGWIDDDDPDCAVGSDEDNETTGFACNDGADNDGDGLIDAEDDGCENGADGSEE